MKNNGSIKYKDKMLPWMVEGVVLAEGLLPANEVALVVAGRGGWGGQLWLPLMNFDK